jgi:NB-ARC domain
MSRQTPVSSWLAAFLIHVAVWLLPANERTRFHEEWMAELEEMRRQDIAPLVPAIRVMLSAPAVGRALNVKGQVGEGLGERLATTAVWERVPPRNVHFTGRENLLRELWHTLPALPGASRLPVALHGLGGVGKTQLAIEYIWRYRTNYDLVWWVPADDPERLVASLAELAPKLGLASAAEEINARETAKTVLEALSHGRPHDRWLLIFDNAHDPESIMEFVPSGPGNVLITSRSSQWADMGRTLNVDVFSPPESQQFLSLVVPGIDGKGAQALAEALGHLPLALEQAVALQAATGMTVEEYLDLLETRVREIQSTDTGPVHQPLYGSVMGVLELLRDEDPDAVALLPLLAYLGTDPVPQDLPELASNLMPPPPPLASVVTNAVRFERALATLSDFTLVRVDHKHKTLQMHYLVQRILRGQYQDPDKTLRAYAQQLLAYGAVQEGNRTPRTA